MFVILSMFAGMSGLQRSCKPLEYHRRDTDPRPRTLQPEEEGTLPIFQLYEIQMKTLVVIKGENLKASISKRNLNVSIAA